MKVRDNNYYHGNQDVHDRLYINNYGQVDISMAVALAAVSELLKNTHELRPTSHTCSFSASEKKHIADI